MEVFIAFLESQEALGTHPVLVAAYLHDELVRIHPFIDGNGRTSRLLMNLYLLRHRYSIVSLKSDNDSKLRYYKALENSHTTGERGDFNAFVAGAVEGTLLQYLKLIRGF
jgi:Fic family protein